MGANIVPTVRIGEPPPQTDEKASQEAAAFSTGRLRRTETRDKHLHYCALVFLWCAFVAFLITSGVWLYHLVTPAAWHFLSDSQRENIQNILVTAIGSVAAGNFGKKYLKGEA